MADDAVDVQLAVFRLHQAAQGRKLIELIALRHEVRGAGFYNFPDSAC